MGNRLAVLAVLLVACGGSSASAPSAVPPRTRIAPPPAEPLMLGIAAIEDGRQGFSNVFFFNVEPANSRCAPIDQAIDHGGVCTIRDCRTEDGSLPERMVDVGELSIRAPQRHAAVLRRDETGVYVIDGEAGLHWASGDALHVELAGGPDGPAVAADLVVPVEPRLISPPLPPPGVTMPLMRASPLAVRWEPFDGLAVVFVGQIPDQDGWWLRHIEMECLVDGEDGALTVPPALLAHFAAGEGYFANLAFAARTYVDVRAGERTVRVVAETGRSINVEME